VACIEIVAGEPEDSIRKDRFSHPDHAAKQSKKQWRVLIVEDELLVAENIKELLGSAGFAIAGIYPTAEEAIENFREMDPDLVLMDIRLAGRLDGIQAAAVIHRDLKKIPILFLTAYGEELLPEIDSIDSGLFDLLTKPYDKLQILESVEHLLKNSSRRLQ
jgi:CheY-like chemotaxis protein